MSGSVNRVILVGRLGSDPELRKMSSGGSVVNVSLATSETWRDKQSGDRQERTEWHRVTFYGKLADIVAEYMSKGRQMYVEGRLQTRKWRDEKLSVDRHTTEIIASEMKMLDGASRGGGDGSQRPKLDDDQPF